MMKDLKRLLKSVSIFDSGKVYSFKFKHSDYIRQKATIQAKIKQTYPNAVILNDISVEEAFEYYKKNLNKREI